MIGRPEDILERVKSFVSMTSKNLFHCGAVGFGVTVKLINDYMPMHGMLVASDGLNMGIKQGIDPKNLSKIINVSSGMSWTMLKSNPCPGVEPNSVASNGYKPGFAIELGVGSVDLAVQRAEKAGARLALAKALQTAYRAACEDVRCKGPTLPRLLSTCLAYVYSPARSVVSLTRSLRRSPARLSVHVKWTSTQCWT